MEDRPLPASEVEVVLSDCSAADAGSLFAALRRRFASEHEAGDDPHETARERPTMWTATFDTSGRPAAEPVVLAGSVTADVQGCPSAVQRLREALDEAFTVHEIGHVAGDQEVQVQLRLEGGMKRRATT